METWLHSNISSAELLSYFQNFRVRRIDRDSDRGGGLLALVSNNLFINVENSCINSYIEFLHISIDRNKAKPLQIVILYKPPTSPENNSNEALNTLLSNINFNNLPMMIIGDFNICLKSMKYNKLNETLLSYGFTTHNIGYTRITPSTKTAIDWVATNCLGSNIIQNLASIDCDFSDHHFICGSIQKLKSRKNYKIVKKLNMSKKNSENFKNELCNINFTENDLCQYLTNVNEAISKTIPSKNVKKPIIICDGNSIVLSEKFIHKVKQRNNYFRKFRKYNNPNDFSMYKKLKYDCRKIAKEDKKHFYNNLAKKCMDSGKNPWKVLNRFLTKKDTYNTIKHISVNKTILTEELAIANAFNNYFSNVISELNINNNYITSKLDISQYYTYDIFKTIDITTFIRNFKQIKMSTFSETFNSIPSQIFKIFFHYFSGVLTSYFNRLIECNIYPQCLKISKVFPVFKAGSKSSVENYRPISMLSTINKIFEKTLYNQLIEFINGENILNPNQFGFRKQHNSEMALNMLLKHTTEKIELNHKVVVCFLDFSKAFDSLDHISIINKLNKQFQIPPKDCFLLLSYLTKRNQYTSINESKSSQSEIKYGVPQGSILGPLLFILFINDIFNNVDCNMLLYADDSVLIISDKNTDKLINKVNLNLKKIQEYCNNNHLFLNIKKTKIIKLNCNEDLSSKFYLNNENVEVVKYYKYLGYNIDDNLKFNLQVESIVNKLNCANHLLAIVRSFLDENFCRILFNCLILSHIIYNKSIILNISCSLKKKLQSKLNISECIIFNKLKKYCGDQKFNLLLLSKKYILLQTYKLIYDEGYVVLKDYLGSLSTRTGNLKCIHHKKQKSNTNFLVFLPKLWNSLPVHIKKCENFSSFKNDINNFFLNL